MSIPVPDLTAALTVETTVTLTDHEGLGIVVSELTSTQQADFFAGLAEGFSQFGDASARGFQMAYIAEAFKDSPDVARGVWMLLHELAEHISEVIEP